MELKNIREKNISNEELYPQHLITIAKWIKNDDAVEISLNGRMKAFGMSGGNKYTAAIAAVTSTLFFFWKPKVIIVVTNDALVVSRNKNIGSMTRIIKKKDIVTTSIDEAWREKKVWIKYVTTDCEEFRLFLPQKEIQKLLGNK